MFLASPALADDATSVARLAAEPSSLPVAGAEYVGTKRCRMCHGKWYESWRASAKGRSWDVLKPHVGAAAKTSAGLDPHRDYTADPQCLTCHTVGYGRPGGYAIPDPNDDRARRVAAMRQGVGCEACHGPGSAFTEVMSDIMNSERSYVVDELRAAGYRPVGPEVCRDCHNRQAICMIPAGGRLRGDEPWLNVNLSDRRGFHEKFRLQYRAAAEHEITEASPERTAGDVRTPGEGNRDDKRSER